MTSATEIFDLDTGVYSLTDAGRIVGRSVGHASQQQIRYWLREGLSESVEVGGTTLLSFQDLVSLEMISRFRDRGISLQAIRVAEKRLRVRHPDLRRPLANLVFYTDGKTVWTQVGNENDPLLLELIGNTDQYAWRRSIETFAEEITFSDGHATAWHPTKWVEINPRLQFGEPVVAGTRVPVRTVMANLEVGTPAEVAEWYGLTPRQVLGVREYLASAA